MKARPLSILILEDNPVVISALSSAITQRHKQAFIRVEQRTEKLAELIKLPANYFDIILLDYVCLTGGNFHTAPLEHFGLNKVISMSTSDRFNEAAQSRGVLSVIKKPLHIDELAVFSEEIVLTIDTKLF